MVGILIQDTAGGAFVRVDMAEITAMKEWRYRGHISIVKRITIQEHFFQPPGCGAILKATESYQELSDTVGQSNYNRSADNDNFKMCNYWIEVRQFTIYII
ncbi:hypothetical protein KIN20_015981 [Parelaphostrongylus tenuis]|uniref:Uncharacterized protein n=1 Tax=Parelaphostrongylus tenuis TaxID=148309 RepID=A0AAD5MFS9_PARTN|nr:hypothetical protein KIN20_015981 [Parelaphostrongylus tenuis]